MRLFRFGWEAGRVLGVTLTRRARAAVALREALERLGGAWVKLGQFVSLRFDLFPPALCQELARLQGTIAGRPGGRAVIESELGQPVWALFDDFDDQPVAAASIGQVYRASVNGRRVAIKAQLPHVAPEMKADLRLMRVAAWLFGWLVPKWRLRALVADFSVVLNEELDYRLEAAETRDLRRQLRAHRIRVPKVYRRLSTARVLTTSWIDGTVMTAYLAAPPYRRGKRIAQRLVRAWFRQIYEDNHFHGDPHPGNLIVRSRGRIAVIDGGTVGTLDTETLATFRAFTVALSAGQYRKAAYHFCLMGEDRNGVDLAGLQPALATVMQRWATRAKVRGLPYHEKSVTACTLALLAVIRKAGGSVDWGWLRVNRALLTLDASIAALHPGINYVRTLRRYFAQAAQRAPWWTRLIALLDRFDEWTHHETRIQRARLLPES